MRKTNKTREVQFLVKRGLAYDNAYRIVYKSKGQAAAALVSLVCELVDRGVELD